MPLELLTLRDLQLFKNELLAELKILIRQDPLPAKKLLKSPEVCRLLRISPGTLQNLRQNETLQFSKIGGILYYRMEDIETLLARRRGNQNK